VDFWEEGCMVMLVTSAVYRKSGTYRRSNQVFCPKAFVFSVALLVDMSNLILNTLLAFL
jgi:hypothetical protein